MRQLLLNGYNGDESLYAACTRAAKYTDSERHADIAEWLRDHSVERQTRWKNKVGQELRTGWK